MKRRTFLASGIGLIGLKCTNGFAQKATPNALQEAPWLSGSSALDGIPTDAVAAPGSVQVVRISPVLYEAFAVILIHNATDDAVMLKSVTGTLSVESLPGFERDQGAYNIPNPIVPPNEYWIGRLMVPTELAPGTNITFDSEVNLHNELPRLTDITTLLSAVAPEEFVLPTSGGEFPILYRNDAPYSPGRIASLQQVFFDDAGEICGFISADDSYQKDGIATFSMTLTNNPGTSTGGAVLGEATENWLAQWFHQPGWLAFEQMDLDN